ncbi:MAG: phenylalanine--tRNA ligase subunit beta [Alphaproteobacteria bacterium]
MKFTLSWLKDHLDTNASLDEISKTLTAIGLEVESITDRSAALKPFTVAKVLHAEKHPEADKLRVCKVQSDIGELQIVCGAPNARAGIFVALAKEGALIPRDQFVIKKTKIRGVESNGMLCSADELGIGGDSEGIIELPESPIGASVAEMMGLNDPVIEIAITPNRADALGIRGIARDLAAAGLGTLKPLPNTSGIKGSFASPVSISIADENCQQFIGCYIKGVKNTPSPVWLKNRLAAIGQKSISALVDISNYITFDLGRPLHVYDAKKLNGSIHVRAAKDGEKLAALDNKEYSLTKDMLVIADDRAALGLGGIIGGMETGCTPETTDVFLEVALFNPISVAKTGRALQLNTDARYRFERGVDVAFVEEGAKHALRLIKELCGGEASELVKAGNTPNWRREIVFNPPRVHTLGGVDVPADKCIQILTSLDFTSHQPQATSHYLVSPPSWRADVEGEADVVEEILRINGYDHIPATPLPKFATITKPALNLMQKRTHLAKRLLAARGFMECCTWSFLAEKQAKSFGGTNAALKLANPISADLDTMRPSLLPNLLDAMGRNANRGFMDLSLFEVGLQFSDTKPEGQRMVAAGVRTGISQYYDYKEQPFKRDGQFINAYDAKADALAVLDALGITTKGITITTNTPAWYHPGRSGALTLGGKIILGYFGEIHPTIKTDTILDIISGFCAFEIFLDAIPTPRAKTKAKASLKLSDYQAVTRDFAFIVDSQVSASDIISAINKAEKQLITNVEIFDVYAGKGVEAGKKSVAVQVTLQAMDKTLSEADIHAISNAIIAAAAKGFGGVLRQ